MMRCPDQNDAAATEDWKRNERKCRVYGIWCGVASVEPWTVYPSACKTDRNVSALGTLIYFPHPTWISLRTGINRA